MKPKRVLVVADEPDLSTIRGIMVNNGILVESDADARNAFAHARRWSPDLVCLDLALTGESGFELCRRIRSNDEVKHIRILAISDQPSLETLKKVESVGVNAFVQKPFSREKLVKYVNALLYGPSAAIRRAPTDASAPTEVPDGSGIRALIEWVMGQAETIHSSVELASKRTDGGLAVLSGDEVVNIVVVLVIGGDLSLFIP